MSDDQKATAEATETETLLSPGPLTEPPGPAWHVELGLDDFASPKLDALLRAEMALELGGAIEDFEEDARRDVERALVVAGEQVRAFHATSGIPAAVEGEEPPPALGGVVLIDGHEDGRVQVNVVDSEQVRSSAVMSSDPRDPSQRREGGWKKLRAAALERGDKAPPATAKAAKAPPSSSSSSSGKGSHSAPSSHGRGHGHKTGR